MLVLIYADKNCKDGLNVKDFQEINKLEKIVKSRGVKNFNLVRKKKDQYIICVKTSQNQKMFLLGFFWKNIEEIKSYNDLFKNC